MNFDTIGIKRNGNFDSSDVTASGGLFFGGYGDGKEY